MTRLEEEHEGGDEGGPGGVAQIGGLLVVGRSGAGPSTQ